MAVDETLAARLRKHLAGTRGVTEKRIFGGLAFLLHGNMCVGVHGSELIVRLAPEQTERALSKAHTRPFDLTGRAMRGWILVQSEGLTTDAALGGWLRTALATAESLPRKK
jgi:hypothetical protein